VEKILASVVFADLMGFTAAVKDYDDAVYVNFVTELRRVAFGAVEPWHAENRVAYGFWGDEVKVIFSGTDTRRNARHAVACACALQAAWTASPLSGIRAADGAMEPSHFKIGVATGEVTVGLFPGAVSPEIEGRPLCTARTLSKQAKFGTLERIFLDAETHALVADLPDTPSFRRVGDLLAFEVSSLSARLYLA